MAHESLPATLAPGEVHLTVRDLARATAFYTGTLGLTARARAAGGTGFAAGGDDLVVLHEDAGAPRVRGTTGLYHFALLVPDRRELARTLAHLLHARTPLTGASDHGVSEALYLPDPEGNGIEIYRDRPRAEWPRDGAGVRMVTDPLDLDGLLAGAGDEPWRGLAPGTRMGHVHLHVAQLEDARRFYVDVLGFDLMQRFGGSALFVSAGGYHHHLGLNTWAGVGAPPPPPGAAGLRHFELRLPDPDACARVAARVRAAGVPVSGEGPEFAFRDPSANAIVLSAR